MQRITSAGPLARYFSAQVVAARRFHLRPAGQSGHAFSVVAGGLERCRPDYRIDRPGFPFPVLEFVAGGSGQLFLGNKRYDLCPGMVFTYGRRCHHVMISDPTHPLVKYFVALGGRGVVPLLRNRGLAPGQALPVREPDRVRQLFDDLIGFGLGDRTDRDACCRQTAEFLLLMVSQLLLPSGRSVARAFATYERCRQYLEQHWSRVAGLRDVAAACHVDQAYLCRLFQRFGREPPHHYLRHLRMNHAMAQLLAGDRMVKDLALEIGFADAANFTRAFRRWYGVPPQAIRRPGP